MSMVKQDLNKMSKEELKQRLKDLRANRRTAYTPSRKKKSPKTDPMFEGISDEIAAKILEDLLSKS